MPDATPGWWTPKNDQFFKLPVQSDDHNDQNDHLTDVPQQSSQKPTFHDKQNKI